MEELELTELEIITAELLSQEDVVETIIRSDCRFGVVKSIELSSATIGKKLIKTMKFDCNCNKIHTECELTSKREEGFTYEIINL